MKQITLTIEVDDNFEPGYCHDCPLSYEDEYYDEDDGYDYFRTCVLCADWEHCPLERCKVENK